jgi:predicted RNA-binding Zn-ribbon protein involved in translation (DUF1610 family)
MIHSDDLPESQEPLMFREITLRVLSPRSLAFLADLIADERVVSVDQLITMPLGEPLTCPVCGWVGINTINCPWGQSKYNKDFYCPKCEGEDE